MTITKLVLLLACMMSVPLEPKEAEVTPLYSKDLTDLPNKEGVMISDPIHRHNAHSTADAKTESILKRRTKWQQKEKFWYWSRAVTACP